MIKYDILSYEKVRKKKKLEKGDCILTYFGSFNPPTNGHLYAMTESYNHMKSLGFNVKSFYDSCT